MARTKGARSLSAELVLKRDFLKTYKKLGPAWLEEQARDAPLEFLKAFITVTKQQPAPAKPTEPEQPPPGGLLSDFEGARRIAFVMASAMHANEVVVDGEVVVEPVQQPAPSWMPPAVDQPPDPLAPHLEEHPPVEQLPAPDEPPPEDKPARRSLADLLGFEPPPATEPSLYGGGIGQYRSGDPSEMGTQRRDLIGDVRVQRKETVADKLRARRRG